MERELRRAQLRSNDRPVKRKKRSMHHGPCPSGKHTINGGIAQLVERQLCKLDVRGSSPLTSTLRHPSQGGVEGGVSAATLKAQCASEQIDICEGKG